MKYTRREFQRIALGSSAWGALTLAASRLPAQMQMQANVPFQPFSAQIERLLTALQCLEHHCVQRIWREFAPHFRPEAVKMLSVLSLESLAPHVLMEVELNPEMRIAVKRGAAVAELYQGGWRTFLVKVSNQAGTTPAVEDQVASGGDLLAGGHPLQLLAFTILRTGPWMRWKRERAGSLSTHSMLRR